MPKIPALNPAFPLTGDEELVLVQGGATKKAAVGPLISAITEQAEAARDAAILAVATAGLETGNAALRGALGGRDAGNLLNRGMLFASAADNAIVGSRFLSYQMQQMLKTLLGIGHSTVQGSGTLIGATTNPRCGIIGNMLWYLAELLGHEYRCINWGVSAQKAMEIAARDGAMPIMVTLNVGTTLAAAGAAFCTATPSPSGPFARRGTSLDTIDGFINGKPCRLINTGTGANANTLVYAIEQIGGTGDITINPLSLFIRASNLHDYAIKLIWPERNDPTTDLSIPRMAVSRLMTKVPSEHRRATLFGNWAFGDGTEDIGSAVHTAILGQNKENLGFYGADFFDPMAFFQERFPYDGTLLPSAWQLNENLPAGWGIAGLTKSATDIADMALGRIPLRFRSRYYGGTDDGHFNHDGYRLLAIFYILLIMKPRGWLK
ncbi:MAG: hypothetical protein A2792_00130 [Sphingomonadales bacterium RIFCSPHIGHO2_01_FULL_65_20]|nr:MAG: hypothetical protein A2792_00130 [Sphingomonadales bacterium RIFCSPHIGHO2_01_FULL_65_20]